MQSLTIYKSISFVSALFRMVLELIAFVGFSWFNLKTFKMTSFNKYPFLKELGLAEDNIGKQACE